MVNFVRRMCIFNEDEIGLGMKTVTMKAIDDYMKLLVAMEIEMVLVMEIEIMMEIMMEMTRR